ncbi:SipW-dependent-type signal peptide-containing protein [Dietzia cercidiphylli]|uniref:Ribosomally synthesized peptide with SipW-like signal peptide n=1 Tax=Dietzia cercidiphylli TaxID=498199 RepID=A0ABP4V314_9ACTN|nr:SipW-dependent-type signal peptide-containing protein [Dietzia cercidiphylli]MBB1048585.1 hypothetical protein [Dietzia cercidiphylli]
MNANEPLTPDAQLKQQERSRKRKAILAGGVVLGLGAAVTLAAWSDDVFANGTFGTGTFELQGNVYGAPESTYENYDTSPGDALTFVLTPNNMAPGDTVYAPISIATSDQTSTEALVSLTGATAPADPNAARLFNNLTFEINTIAEGGICNPAVFGAGTELLGPGALTRDLADAFTVAANQDTEQHLCFAVTLPDNETTGAVDMQGLSTGPVVWQFTGESVTTN